MFEYFGTYLLSILVIGEVTYGTFAKLGLQRSGKDTVLELLFFREQCLVIVSDWDEVGLKNTVDIMAA